MKAITPTKTELHAQIELLEARIQAARDYVDGYIDVKDGPDGPVPNLAMSVAQILDGCYSLPKSGGDFEALRAALLAYYEKEGDETACHILSCKTSTMTELTGFVLHEIDTMHNMALDAGCDAERAIKRAEKAEGDLESATQPLDAQMARLNARVVELNKAELALRNIRMYAAMHRKEPWAPTLLRFCEDGGVKGSPLRAETPHDSGTDAL